MKNILTGLFAFLLGLSRASADIRLAILANPGNSTVTLRWNMTDYPGFTTYALFESQDGISWTIAAANPAQRRYAASTIMEFRKKFSDQRQMYFRVKVYDPNENIIAISNTALVVNPKFIGGTYLPPHEEHPGRTSESNMGTSQWQMPSHPGWDHLELHYVGRSPIQGVINVDIFDGYGKIVQRFRASSKSKQLEIPVRQLQNGTYHIRVSVEGQTQLNTYFTKS